VVAQSRPNKRAAESKDAVEGGEKKMAQHKEKKVRGKLGMHDNELNGALTNKVSTSYKTTLKQLDAMKEAITKDKNDRATVDQVLDPRTLIILDKLV